MPDARAGVRATARDVQLDAAVGRDGEDPPERRGEREDTERLGRQPARRDDRDEENGSFTCGIGERLVGDEARVPQFRVTK